MNEHYRTDDPSPKEPPRPASESEIEGQHQQSRLDRATYSVEEAAKKLGIGRSLAYDAANDGTLPVIRVKGRILVIAAKLDAMLEA